MESKLIKRGATKNIVTTSESGIETSAVKKHTSTITIPKPLIICMPILLVIRFFTPPSNGTKTRLVKRKAILDSTNMIWYKGYLGLKNLIAISCIENSNCAIKMHPIPKTL